MNWKQRLGIRLGNLYFNNFVKQKRVKEIKRVIVFGLPGLGDCLMITPSIHRFKEINPDIRLTAFLYPHTVPLFKDNPYIDEVIIRKGNSIFSTPFLKYKYDMAIMLEMFTTPVYAYLCGIPIRRGCCINNNGFALTHKFYSKEIAEGKVTCMSWAAKIYGVDTKYNIPELYNIDIRKEYKDKIFLFPDVGTNDSAKKKRWKLDNWVELIKMIGPKKCVIRGLSETIGNYIEERCSGVENQMHPKIHIIETLRLIKSCKLVVTHDSFPLHAAAAFNKHTVVIFGPTDPVFLAPYPNANTVQHKLPCHSCFYTDRVDICRTQECLKRITPDEVYTEIAMLLNNNIYI